MIELLFLLLPVAAGYGYIMGKNNAKSQARIESREIISEYSKGLRFLLEREEDQGLQHLIELLEVSADSVEHYLTLATMFRRRGELDRAIKIHELLLKQSNLPKSERNKILYELAHDYISAGMLDKAEHHLLKLVDTGDVKSLSNLLSLYQQTHEWSKGMSLYHQFPKLITTRQLKTTIANFFCEQAILENDPELIKHVINLDDKIVRPLYELGAQAFEQNDFLKALNYWGDLLHSAPHFAPMFLDKLKVCYQELGLQEQFEALLKKALSSSSVLVKIYYCQSLVNRGAFSKAKEFLTASLIKQPNIRGFSYLIELLAHEKEETKDVLTQINTLVQNYIATKTAYQCQHCGFSSNTLYWFCPSCKHWESMTPNQGVDGF